jgi:hypothetical protein
MSSSSICWRPYEIKFKIAPKLINDNCFSKTSA